MGFSSLANMSKRIPHGNRQSPRVSKISGFTVHHHAGVDAMGEATNPSREVSANYWISNAGDIIPQVDESMRAWTSGAVGYPAGAESDHRNITVEVSNSPEGVRDGTWAVSDAAYQALVKLMGDVFKRHNLGTVRRGTSSGVAVHQDFVATACPGPYIMSHLGAIIAEAEKYRAGGGAPGPAPSPGTGGGAVKSVAVLAQEVLAGKHGTGEVRRRSLGSNYSAVQAEVNRLLGITPSSGGGGKTINQLADEVLAGRHGTGDARKRSLGSNYSAVQALVNKRLGLSTGSVGGGGVNVDALARAVIRGDYGVGAERQRRLGANYAAVQHRVNVILGLA